MANRGLLDTKQVRRDLDTLRSDLGRVRSDLGEVVGALVEASRKGGRQMGEQMRAGVNRRLNELNDTYAQARERSTRAMRTARRQASEHPLLSTLAVLAIGSVIVSIIEGALMWRRR